MRRLPATVFLCLVLAAPAGARPVTDGPPPLAAAARAAADWRPDVSAARAWAGRRRGDVSFAVRTPRRGWSWRAATPYRSASLVKAMLLVGYLRRADVRDRALRREERGLLGPMVTRSSNRAADAIHARLGLPALSALARRAGMRHFVPHPVWGGSTVTAIDQARFFLRIDRLVPPRHRDYAVGLLRGVVDGQRWGIPQATPAGWEIAFKGGWGRGVTRQVDHQAALLTRGRERVAIAVLSADNPSDAYGAATLRGVAARLLRGLDRPVEAPAPRGDTSVAASGRLGSCGEIDVRHDMAGERRNRSPCRGDVYVRHDTARERRDRSPSPRRIPVRRDGSARRRSCLLNAAVVRRRTRRIANGRGRRRRCSAERPDQAGEEQQEDHHCVGHDEGRDAGPLHVMETAESTRLFRRPSSTCSAG